ncbi:MAG TPA: hypothetical protein VF473_09630 [Cyclobacteriaceae bacterium]
MKKIFFLIAFVLLTFGNRAMVTLISNQAYDYAAVPVSSNNTEENSEEEHKNLTEEDDDSEAVYHRWLSQELTTESEVHILYQEIVFNDLELAVKVPPPKA